LLAGLVAGALGLAGTAGEPPERAPGREGLEVDRERGEVRVPCRFVNPSRLLEVFACHEKGPAHETVLEFDVTGPALYQALIDIGTRNASYWNGTSPEDFLGNQGDRLLLLVRWEHGGSLHEHAAEAMLLEGETGFRAFVRGFSFGARSPRKVEDIPAAVEITLGGTKRQSPAFSLLSHPTGSGRMLPWMLPPVLDTDVVEGHLELVEKKVPATLIIRRVRSEADLVRASRAAAESAGDGGRVALLDGLLAIAEEIDRLKAEYEKLLASMRRFLEASGDVEGLTEEEKGARARIGRDHLARGRWLCARIEERYLTLRAREEEHKARWIRGAREIPEDARDEALLLASAFLFEPRIAGKEVEIAALDLGDAGRPPAERKLLESALRKEIEAIEIERGGLIAAANLKYYERRLKEVDPADAYTRRLFEEDVMRSRIEMRRLSAQGRVTATEVAELRGTIDGSWEAAREKVLAERKAAGEEIRLAGLEQQLLEVLEEIRWNEGDAESDDPGRSEKAKRELIELERKKKDLEEKLKGTR
jgi:hypothetical protein